MFSRLVAWALYFGDLTIALATTFLGIQYLITSESKADLLLNVVALRFILDIDEVKQNAVMEQKKMSNKIMKPEPYVHAFVFEHVCFLST